LKNRKWNSWQQRVIKSLSLVHVVLTAQFGKKTVKKKQQQQTATKLKFKILFNLEANRR